MNKINLTSLCGGTLQEKFDKAVAEVAENLLDPNTPYKPARKVNIELKFTQNETRDDLRCEVNVTNKLAPQSGILTAFDIGKNLRTGEIEMEEYGKQTAGQMRMDDKNLEIDESTGEVLSDTAQIVDFRQTMAK